MANQPFFTGLLLVAVLVCAGRPAHSDTNPSLTVRVEDRANVPGHTLKDAEAVAAGIYRRAGVALRWTDSSGESAASALAIVIVATTTPMEHQPAEDSMGVTPNDGVRGRVAYVFYNRVAAFGESGRVETWVVLGCVMAHELGHLLLPLNAHSADGVMRAHWDPKFVPRAGAGVLNFSAEQARLIRARLAYREP